ncbi:MAG: methyltransferase domain-containing protein [Pseudomonadota bacterium]
MTQNVTEEAGTFYAEAAKNRSDASSYCAPTPDTALAAGYDATTLSSVPEEAVSASFGCGDPVSFSKIEPGQTILDLGCGAGLDLVIAAEKTGPEGRVIGVDASADMLGLAKANAERAGYADRIDLRQGVIENLPVEDESIDWVISNCVVNLSPDKHQVFREIHRVLKPGGRAIIADLVADDLPDWVTTHKDLYSACVSGAVSEQTYVALAQAAGLVTPEVIARMHYDEAMVRHLISCALPLSLDEIAAELSLSTEALMDRAGKDLAARITSVKVQVDKPVY